jgi:PKD repeat protein
MVDNGPANILAMLYDTNSQTWSSDLRLNENDWSSKDVSGFYGSDGKLRMAFLATQVLRRAEDVIIEGQSYEVQNVPEDGQTDLRLLEHSLITDLSIRDADLQLVPQAPQAGESVTATVNIRNAGDFSIGAFNVKLYAGNPSAGGVLLAATRFNGPFLAGSARMIALSFAYPQTVSNIVVVIDADNEINEFSEANNRATVYFDNTPPFAIVTANVTSGGAPLAVDFDATSSYDSEGDALSFAWSFTDGSPSGAGARVSHTFDQIGLYQVTLSVTDSRGAVSTTTVNISVNCSPLAITPSILPGGAIGSNYSQNLSAAGGTTPYSFTVTSGALPAGLTLATDGQLSGRPTTGGTFNFTIMATYGNGCPGSRDYILNVDASPTPMTVQFGANTASSTETANATTNVNLVVTRTGDTTTPVTVNYASSDGTANERSDYLAALGTMNFAAGETSKQLASSSSTTLSAKGRKPLALLFQIRSAARWARPLCSQLPSTAMRAWMGQTQSRTQASIPTSSSVNTILISLAERPMHQA